MRRSTIPLTVDLYGKLGLEDVADDIWTLPPLFAQASAAPGTNSLTTEI